MTIFGEKMIISYDLAAPKVPQNFLGEIFEKNVDETAIKSGFRGLSKSDQTRGDPPPSKSIPSYNLS